jgi:superfamily II DNA/RNA helicase
LSAVLPALPESTPRSTPGSTADDVAFDALGLPDRVVAALARQDITSPTPVQAAVIPDAMSGHDVLGRAQTGSGKTLAFGLPILARLAGRRSRPKHPRALIIVPTRELATQVRRSLEPLAHAVHLKLTTVYGGTPYDRQIKQLRNGADIVVATPGRLEDLIERGSCRTDDVEVTVLDEADHLCDLGFYPVVDALLAETPEGSQRLLLSATLDGDVDRLVRTHLRDPRLHELDPSQGAVATSAHHVMVVGGYRDKLATAAALVEANPRAIVFTRTRDGATELRESFAEGGIKAVDLHGSLSQRVRERNLHKFSTGVAQVVVATDVAARGIHVDNVGLVVHYDPPTDPKAYLHRSGRTARAGESGAVVTISTPRQLDEVVRMQSRAGVESLHHDIRTAPQPMTAEALGESGAPAPDPRGGTAGGSRGQRGGRRNGPRGSRNGGGDRGYRGARDEGTGFRGGRSNDGDRRPGNRDRGAGGPAGDRDARGARREGRAPYRDARREGGRREAVDRGGFAPARAGRDAGVTSRGRRTSGDARPDFRDRGFRRDRGDYREDRTQREGRTEFRRDRAGGPKKPRWSQSGKGR